MLRELAVFLSLLVLQSLRGAQAQSDATCTDSAYSWSFNSLNQSPCDIGRLLGTVCTSDFSIQALPSGYHYSGVGQIYATECVCNTVYYSLLNVCAACQGGSVSIWGDWDFNCTTTYQTYPSIRVLRRPTLRPPVPRRPVVLLRAPASNSPSSTPTPASESSSSSSSSNTGAIVGGVVGGVVGLAIIAALVFFLVRRRRRRPAAVATTGPIGGDIPPPTSSFVGQNLTGSAYAPTVYDKVYDPNDPSTFPSANGVPYGQQQGYPQPYAPLPPSSPDSTMIPNRFSPAQPTSPPPASAYRGAPEV
ncbi:hypothetical protein IW261DRAFT_1565904 [Armillaria novae-zelandiae]|uniref:Transmembrane protein n=1 Tax=Armillaria novae-zelandiae TaxID=153914 RepID=A0AA39P4T0_9AGAR|nr:hypothetical protein IW261DRAFT_1565904 [Armillaria novae-zelandiae]